MQRPNRYIFRNGKVFSYQSPWMKDPARMTDMELRDALEKANEEYKSCLWRMNTVDSQQEPYRSIREKVFAIRREMVNRWYTKTKPGLN